MSLKNLNEVLGIHHIQKNYFPADWPAPISVKTLITTRLSGFSRPPFNTLNLALHVGDDLASVKKNRFFVQKLVPLPIIYLNQIHSNHIVTANIEMQHHPFTADAIYDTTGTLACAVLTADCLPIFICNLSGTKVAAVHAGWKGLASGIIENTLQVLQEPHQQLMVFLGPAISQDAFEIGQEVLTLFLSDKLKKYQLQSCFEPIYDKKYLANLYAIAQKIFSYHGVKYIYGGNFCTVLQNKYFYSHRKEHQTGRFASIIWLENNY